MTKNFIWQIEVIGSFHSQNCQKLLNWYLIDENKINSKIKLVETILIITFSQP